MKEQFTVTSGRRTIAVHSGSVFTAVGGFTAGVSTPEGAEGTLAPTSLMAVTVNV